MELHSRSTGKNDDIEAAASITMAQMTLTNVAILGNAADYAGGGGIHNIGTMTMTNAYISGNYRGC